MNNFLHSVPPPASNICEVNALATSAEKGWNNGRDLVESIIARGKASRPMIPSYVKLPPPPPPKGKKTGFKSAQPIIGSLTNRKGYPEHQFYPPPPGTPQEPPPSGRRHRHRRRKEETAVAGYPATISTLPPGTVPPGMPPASVQSAEKEPEKKKHHRSHGKSKSPHKSREKKSSTKRKPKGSKSVPRTLQGLSTSNEINGTTTHGGEGRGGSHSPSRTRRRHHPQGKDDFLRELLLKSFASRRRHKRTSVNTYGHGLVQQFTTSRDGRKYSAESGVRIHRPHHYHSHRSPHRRRLLYRFHPLSHSRSSSFSSMSSRELEDAYDDVQEEEEAAWRKLLSHERHRNGRKESIDSFLLRRRIRKILEKEAYEDSSDEREDDEDNDDDDDNKDEISTAENKGANAPMTAMYYPTPSPLAVPMASASFSTIPLGYRTEEQPYMVFAGNMLGNSVTNESGGEVYGVLVSGGGGGGGPPLLPFASLQSRCMIPYIPPMMGPRRMEASASPFVVEEGEEENEAVEIEEEEIEEEEVEEDSEGGGDPFLFSVDSPTPPPHAPSRSSLPARTSALPHAWGHFQPSPASTSTASSFSVSARVRENRGPAVRPREEEEKGENRPASAVDSATRRYSSFSSLSDSDRRSTLPPVHRQPTREGHREGDGEDDGPPPPPLLHDGETQAWIHLEADGEVAPWENAPGAVLPIERTKVGVHPLPIKKLVRRKWMRRAPTTTSTTTKNTTTDNDDFIASLFSSRVPHGSTLCPPPPSERTWEASAEESAIPFSSFSPTASPRGSVGEGAPMGTILRPSRTTTVSGEKKKTIKTKKIGGGEEEERGNAPSPDVHPTPKATARRRPPGTAIRKRVVTRKGKNLWNPPTTHAEVGRTVTSGASMGSAKSSTTPTPSSTESMTWMGSSTSMLQGRSTGGTWYRRIGVHPTSHDTTLLGRSVKRFFSHVEAQPLPSDTPRPVVRRRARTEREEEEAAGKEGREMTSVLRQQRRVAYSQKQLQEEEEEEERRRRMPVRKKKMVPAKPAVVPFTIRSKEGNGPKEGDEKTKKKKKKIKKILKDSDASGVASASVRSSAKRLAASKKKEVQWEVLPLASPRRPGRYGPATPPAAAASSSPASPPPPSSSSSSSSSPMAFPSPVFPSPSHSPVAVELPLLVPLEPPLASPLDVLQSRDTSTSDMGERGGHAKPAEARPVHRSPSPSPSPPGRTGSAPLPQGNTVLKKRHTRWVTTPDSSRLPGRTSLSSPPTPLLVSSPEVSASASSLGLPTAAAVRGWGNPPQKRKKRNTNTPRASSALAPQEEPGGVIDWGRPSSLWSSGPLPLPPLPSGGVGGDANAETHPSKGGSATDDPQPRAPEERRANAMASMSALATDARSKEEEREREGPPPLPPPPLLFLPNGTVVDKGVLSGLTRRKRVVLEPRVALSPPVHSPFSSSSASEEETTLGDDDTHHPPHHPPVRSPEDPCGKRCSIAAGAASSSILSTALSSLPRGSHTHPLFPPSDGDRPRRTRMSTPRGSTTVLYTAEGAKVALTLPPSLAALPRAPPTEGGSRRLALLSLRGSGGGEVRGARREEAPALVISPPPPPPPFPTSEGGIFSSARVGMLSSPPSQPSRVPLLTVPTAARPTPSFPTVHCACPFSSFLRPLPLSSPPPLPPPPQAPPHKHHAPPPFLSSSSSSSSLSTAALVGDASGAPRDSRLPMHSVLPFPTGFSPASEEAPMRPPPLPTTLRASFLSVLPSTAVPVKEESVDDACPTTMTTAMTTTIQVRKSGEAEAGEDAEGQTATLRTSRLTTTTTTTTTIRQRKSEKENKGSGSMTWSRIQEEALLVSSSSSSSSSMRPQHSELDLASVWEASEATTRRRTLHTAGPSPPGTPALSSITAASIIQWPRRRQMGQPMCTTMGPAPLPPPSPFSARHRSPTVDSDAWWCLPRPQTPKPLPLGERRASYGRVSEDEGTRRKNEGRSSRPTPTDTRMEVTNAFLRQGESAKGGGPMPLPTVRRFMWKGDDSPEETEEMRSIVAAFSHHTSSPSTPLAPDSPGGTPLGGGIRVDPLGAGEDAHRHPLPDVLSHMTRDLLTERPEQAREWMHRWLEACANAPTEEGRRKPTRPAPPPLPQRRTDDIPPVPVTPTTTTITTASGTKAAATAKWVTTCPSLSFPSLPVCESAPPKHR